MLGNHIRRISERDVAHFDPAIYGFFRREKSHTKKETTERSEGSLRGFEATTQSETPAVLLQRVGRLAFFAMSIAPKNLMEKYMQSTDPRTRLIDLLILFGVMTVGIIIGYAFLVGSFPFNSVVASIFSSGGMAVLAGLFV